MLTKSATTFISLLLLCSISGLATAQEKLTLRTGTLTLKETDGDISVLFNNKPVGLKDAFVSFKKSHKIDNVDIAVVQLSSGGVACPATFAFIVVKDGTAQASKPFGSCSDLSKISSTPDSLTVATPKMGSAPAETGIYKNGTITINGTPQAVSPHVAAPTDNGGSQNIAKPQVAIQETPQNPELEKAWACEPKIQTWQGREESFLGFFNHKCNPGEDVYPPIGGHASPEIIRMAELLLNTYHVNLRNKNTFKVFHEEAKIREQRAQEKANGAQQVKNERARKLRSGEIKIASMEDALAAYPDQDVLIKTAMSPLLAPSGAVITGFVVLDAQEKPGFIRAKATTPIAIHVGQEGRGNAYIYLTLTKQSVNFAPDKLRINGSAQVIGKYVQNAQYQTVAGQQKTAPVLEVMYINPVQ